MFTHCRWKPFQNHLPSGCRYCRLTSDIFTQEFFTGSPDMLPILKTPNISTISTNRNLKNFQEVFMLSRTVFGSTNMLTLWRLVRNATYLISLNLLLFRIIHWLFETRCLCLCRDSKKTNKGRNYSASGSSWTTEL